MTLKDVKAELRILGRIALFFIYPLFILRSLALFSYVVFAFYLSSTLFQVGTLSSKYCLALGSFAPGTAGECSYSLLCFSFH